MTGFSRQLSPKKAFSFFQKCIKIKTVKFNFLGIILQPSEYFRKELINFKPMFISWLGQTCFKIQGQTATILIDPYGPASGLKFPKTAADIVIIADQNLKDNAELVKGTQADQLPFVIAGAGEFEVKDALMFGIRCQNGKTENQPADPKFIYQINIDEITIVHLGVLNHDITEEQFKYLEDVDVLLVPVGGGNALNAKQAMELINKIEPRMVIPMNYKIPGLKEKLEPLDKFCKEIGICPTEHLPKIKVTAKDMPSEEMKVVVLKNA